MKTTIGRKPTPCNPEETCPSQGSGRMERGKGGESSLVRWVKRTYYNIIRGKVFFSSTDRDVKDALYKYLKIKGLDSIDIGIINDWKDSVDSETILYLLNKTISQELELQNQTSL